MSNLSVLVIVFTPCFDVENVENHLITSYYAENNMTSAPQSRKTHTLLASFFLISLLFCTVFKFAKFNGLLIEYTALLPSYLVLQEAQHRKRDGLSSWLDFPAAQQLQNISLPVDLLPGEKDIKVIDNLCRDHRNRYQHQGGPWVHYDILMGDIMTTGTTCSQEILRKVDQEIGLNREQVS